MAKKAKAKRRVIVPTWIVRDENEVYAVFVSQAKPRLTPCEHGCNPTTWKVAKVHALHLCTDEYEASTEADCHLKPGGGPLKVKLVRA